MNRGKAFDNFIHKNTVLIYYVMTEPSIIEDQAVRSILILLMIAENKTGKGRPIDKICLLDVLGQLEGFLMIELGYEGGILFRGRADGLHSLRRPL